MQYGRDDEADRRSDKAAGKEETSGDIGHRSLHPRNASRRVATRVDVPVVRRDAHGQCLDASASGAVNRLCPADSLGLVFHAPRHDCGHDDPHIVLSSV